MASTRVSASIIVFKSEPVDYQKYRHTALFFEFEDGQPAVYIHATGTQRDFSVEQREGYNPRSSRQYVKQVEVGWLGVAMTRAHLISCAWKIGPDNESYEYNCHSWVQEVLSSFQRLGYLSLATYKAALDGMIEGTLEAADD